MGLDWELIFRIGGPVAVVLVAWWQGLWIAKPELTRITSMYDVRLKEAEQKAADAVEDKKKAEADRDRMQEMLFKQIGVSGMMIEKATVLPVTHEPAT